MNNLYEQDDILNSPYEAFIFDSVICPTPVKPHWHYFIELIYIIEGEAFIVCDDKEYTLTVTDFILFHPQSVHSIVNTTNNHLQYYVIKFDINRLHTHSNYLHSIAAILRAAKKDLSLRINFNSNDFSRIDLYKLLSNCAFETYTKDYGYDILFQTLMTQLLTEIIRIWRHEGFKTETLPTKSHDFDKLENILEYIDEHFSEPISISELAQTYHMSYSYFAKCFHSQYGRSCKDYIEFVRISKVKDLLLFTNYDLTYISNETGFSDCSHLIRIFRKSTGITPKQFRLKYSI